MLVTICSRQCILQIQLTLHTSKKAEHFDDDMQVVKVLNTNSLFEAKRLGGRVHNFDIDKWS